jgi:hypothetical protein
VPVWDYVIDRIKAMISDNKDHLRELSRITSRRFREAHPERAREQTREASKRYDAKHPDRQKVYWAKTQASMTEEEKAEQRRKAAERARAYRARKKAEKEIKNEGTV